MRETIPSRIVGVVQVRVAGRVYALPVHSMTFLSDDGSPEAGGFFHEGANLGIVVSEGASAQDVQAQVNKACVDAVRHLSQRFLS